MQNFLDEINSRVKSNFNARNGDYFGEDGMLYCGICNTRKTCRIKLPTLPGMPSSNWKVVNCACSHELEARVAREAARVYSMSIERNTKTAFPHADYKHMTFDADDMKNPCATEYARRFAETFNPENSMGLVFCGERGAGKTFLSACIANDLLKRGFSVVMTNITRISQAVDATFDGRAAEIKRLMQLDLLIIDDLGTERGTEYMMEHAFNIIDGRYKANKPMIISTNVTFEEISIETDLAKGRIYDRIIEKCFPVEMRGNRRLNIAVANRMKDGISNDQIYRRR